MSKNTEPPVPLENLAYNDTVTLPARYIAMYKTLIANNDQVQKNILVTTWGGIGDHLCAEPTLRYILKTFKDCRISLSSIHPELFQHLSFYRVYNPKQEEVFLDQFLKIDTNVPVDDTNIVQQFMSHVLTNGVEFSSICALRRQLPIADRELKHVVPDPENPKFKELPLDVVVHPGRHWKSKTYPADFWNAVLKRIIANGFNPVLIGGERAVVNDAKQVVDQGTVDVDVNQCIDLRGRTTMPELIWLCQKAKVVLTNDSAPLHAAASGNAWVGFITTCKEPGLLLHWRKGKFGWRMKNFGKGGLYETQDYSPYVCSSIMVTDCTDEQIRSWLPNPIEYANWACARAAAGTEVAS